MEVVASEGAVAPHHGDFSNSPGYCLEQKNNGARDSKNVTDQMAVK